MALKNTSEAWGWLARLLHWTIALLMLALLGIGFYMANVMPIGFERLELTQTHKSFGFTVFILAVIRVVWRFSNRQTPVMPVDMPGWQVLASHASHWVLYILMFALPLSGWLMATSSPLNDLGVPNMVFGKFNMPDMFVPGDKDLTELFHLIHESCAFALCAVLLVHTGAALKHHFVEKDRILMRMISGK